MGREPDSPFCQGAVPSYRPKSPSSDAGPAEAGSETAMASATETRAEPSGEEEREDFAESDLFIEECEDVGEDGLAFEGPPDVPRAIADALQNRDWPNALRIAIGAGWRDEGKLTNLVFFARHPELGGHALDPKHPRFEDFSREWVAVRDVAVRQAIEQSAQNTDLVVSGEEATSYDKHFRSQRGQRFKALIEQAANDVNLNPGLLAATLLAETGSRNSYLTSSKVSSYHIGVDDFYDRRSALAARVPAYSRVRWDKHQVPEVHNNDAKKPRAVRTIWFDLGPAALLASAVYLKYGEVRLQEEAVKLGGDFNGLALEPRWALTRIAFNAGVGGARKRLARALRGEDILVRKDVRVKAYQTDRNATVRVAQAMHLSAWVFAIPVRLSVAHQEVEGASPLEGLAAAGFNTTGESLADSWLGATETASGDGLEEAPFESEDEGVQSPAGGHDSGPLVTAVDAEEDREDSELDLEHLGVLEFQVGGGLASPTLGFEFDLNFGFELEVAEAKGLRPPAGFDWPSEGLKVTDHEWKDGVGNFKDAFVVTMDAVRMEIATVPFHVDNEAEFKTVVSSVAKFGQELIHAKKVFERGLKVASFRGHPITLEHPRTVVNKVEVDAHGVVNFPGDREHASYQHAPVPLVVHRVSGAYPESTALRSAPQATVTLPLAEFGKLVWEIHQTKGGAPGEAFTGRESDRLGLRDDLAWLALKRAVADRKRKLGSMLSDGTKVTELDYSRAVTAVVTILLIYMLTSIKRDERDAERESFAKGSLPLNVKTPLWQIHRFALTAREKFVLHELYTDKPKRPNLYALASSKSRNDGRTKLFPDYTHMDVLRFRSAVPTWDSLIDALVKEQPVIVTVENQIPKKGHRKGDEILIAPLSSKIDWAKTKPRIAVEMRRLGFAWVNFSDWPQLMHRVRELTKRVNP